MNLTSPAIRQSVRCRTRAFTALEALVMLAALFILTMLGIGLWMKKNKEDKSANSAAPQNTIDTAKPEAAHPDKKPPAVKPEIKTAEEQEPASKAPE